MTGLAGGWRAGHYVRVNLQEGSKTCGDSSTVTVDYFANNSDCSGAPNSSMVIATNGTVLDDGCRDIYGNVWANFTCSASLDAEIP